MSTGPFATAPPAAPGSILPARWPMAFAKRKMPESVPPGDCPADLGHVEIERHERHLTCGGETVVDRRRGEHWVVPLAAQPRGERGERLHITLRTDGNQQYFTLRPHP